MSALRNLTFRTFVCVLFSLLVKGLSSTPVNVPLTSVSTLLVKTAVNSLNENSQNHQTYRNGHLISAQKLEEPPFTVYRLTLNLDPICDEKSTCPREACTLEVKQHEQGAVTVNRDSVQCMHLYPQSKPQISSSDQELIESLERQIGDSINLDHEVQTSADHNDRPFIAVPASKSHYCPGCPYDLDPSLPGLSAFVDQIIRSVDESLASDFKHKAIRILRVSRAVPPNANVVRYEIILQIGETSCLKTSLLERAECPVQPNLPIKLCKVTLEEKPWEENSRRITRNNCTETNLENELNSSLGPNSASKNTPENIATIASNPEDEEMKTEFYDQVAQEGKFSTYETMIDQYFESPNLNLTVEGEDGNIKKVVVEKPIEKVVLEREDVPEKPKGFVDKMREFDSFLGEFDVLVREMSPPPKDERIPVVEEVIKPVKIGEDSTESSEEKSDLTEKSRKRREVLVGGHTQRDINDPEIQSFTQLGLKKYSEQLQGSNEPLIVEIIEATSQVVSGTLHKIRVRFGMSNCPRGKTENCQLQSEGGSKECLIKVWSQPWLDKGNPKVTVECDTGRKKRSLSSDVVEKSRKRREMLVGGATPKDVNDPKIQSYAQLGLKKYSEQLQGSKEPLIAEIVEASTQVVSGSLYKIRVRFGMSNCPRGETENCQLESEGELKECLIKVWSQPWLDKGNPKVTVECDSERKKRSPLVGNPRSVDVNDPEIQSYAQLGLKKYSEQLQGPNEPLIAKVVEASTQVVSGTLYRIRVHFGLSDCPKGKTANCQLQSESELKECVIKIWSQPWIDKGNPEVTLECDTGKKKRTIKNSEEVEEEQNTNQSRGRHLKGQNYSQKMLKLGEELKKEQMEAKKKDLGKVLTEEIQDDNFKTEKLFDDFTQKFNRAYKNDEEKQKRFGIFKENLKKIQELVQFEQGTAEYGVTMFSDLTQEEFKSNYLGLKPELKSENEIPFPMAEIPDMEIPTEFDWRQKNVVTGVKDQGQCGSCWAFSVTGNVEGQYAIKHGKLLSLSEQELLDCDKLDGGCDGGLMDSAYRAIEKLGGLETETDYSYDAERETCHFSKSKAKVQVVSAVNITSDETEMAKWLVKNGPISIAINANAMQFYMGGISHPPKFLCNPKNLDHGVLIVGYGVKTYPIFKKILPYWIVKNSWGPRWGERGYYRVFRGGSTCGVNQMASSAVVA